MDKVKVIKDKMILPCLRGVIGDWVYYSALMTAKQMNEWVEPVKDIRESKELHDVLQRALKQERQEKIREYLLEVKSHFFNSIIVGVFDGTPDWLELSFSEKIVSEIGSNLKNELEESIGIMIFKGSERMFAIDGQHRVEGIKSAFKMGEEKGFGALLEDQFSVLLVGHIDDYLGKKRTRKLFSDINKNAKQVAEGDELKIDEENLNAIVTRRIYAQYTYFKNGNLISLTETAKLDKNDISSFTNLLGLNSVNKILRKLFRKSKGTKEWDEENVQSFYEIVESFYDFIINNITEYKEFFIDTTLSLEKARDENKYLLFRPIGLTLLARIYVHFHVKDKGLIFLKNNINKIGFIFPESPYNKILWNKGNMDAKTVNQNLAFELSLHLLADLDDRKESELLEKYKKMTKDETAQLPEKVI